MNHPPIRRSICVLTAVGLFAVNATAAQRIETSGRLGEGMTMTAVTTSDTAEPMTVSSISAGLPRPPMLGFSPLVAISLSDERSNADLDFEHNLHYFGVDTLDNPPSPTDFAVGIVDSGSIVDLAAEPYATQMALTGARLTQTTFPIGGAGGTVDTLISEPLGVFAGGLEVIQPDGMLDVPALVGHSNVRMLAAPEISCGPEERFRAVIGTGFLGFFTTSILHSTPINVEKGGETLTSPTVRIEFPHTPSPVTYPRQISMTTGMVTTASYYDFPFGGDVEPFMPTMLSLSAASLPLGEGLFYAQVGLLEGEPSSTNPLQTFTMVVDTGAQSSVISSGVVADLSLPLAGDFTIEVCGIGGPTVNKGYYIDYVKINAAGGALEFGNAPFVVLDSLPAGVDGIIGMNFFRNRDIVFDVDLLGSSFLHVSEPFDLPFGDLDRDGDVDGDDYTAFSDCLSGPTIEQMNPLCIEADADGDLDVDQEDFGVFQVCLSGDGNPADPACDD